MIARHLRLAHVLGSGPGGRASSSPVQVPAGGVLLEADLGVPATPRGVIVFAHGSGSSRHSPRNQRVARHLRDLGFATLLADLLTPSEEALDERTAQLRFDIDRLATRVTGLVDWTVADSQAKGLPIGLFGASTGAAAALVAAAARPREVGAVVSRGGRPDLAGGSLGRVLAPTLLLVGELDTTVVAMNRDAERRMAGRATLEIVPGASHLFEEPGTLDIVSARAGEWFLQHLRRGWTRRQDPGSARG